MVFIACCLWLSFTANRKPLALPIWFQYFTFRPIGGRIAAMPAAPPTPTTTTTMEANKRTIIRFELAGHFVPG